MTRQTIVAIAATEAQDAVERAKDRTLEGRFAAACASTKTNWMAPTEDEAFSAAVAALLLSCTDDERQRVEEELHVIRTLNAMLSGVSVDFDNLPEAKDPIGLMRIWREGVAAPDAQEGDRP